MGNPVEVDDALVLLLGAPSHRVRPGRIEGVTRLEKLLFILDKEGDAKDWMSEDPEFVPYNYGPFTPKVYQAVDTLSTTGIIEDSKASARDDSDTWEERDAIGSGNAIGESDEAPNPYVTRDFSLTDRGWKYYHVLEQEVGRKVVDGISAIKDDFAALPLNQLVRYVYSNHDEFTSKSLIRDQVLRGHEQ